MVIEWQEEYNIGIRLIDAQHQGFVETFNRLYEAFLQKKPEMVLSNVLKQLESYAEYHFSTEEGYFDEFCYEDFAEHKSRHDQFRASVKEFRNRLIRGEGYEQLAAELVRLMDDWFLHHIRTEDPKYVACFRSHGLD